MPPTGTPAALSPEEALWAEAKKWTEAAGMMEKCKLASQVMTGFALMEIRKSWNGQGKRTDLTLEVGTSPNRSAKLGWQKRVKAELGISDDTARNWMDMAKACKPRLKKLGGMASFKDLLQLPPSQWTDVQRDSLSTAVRKITDGKTQLEFMWELGVAKGGKAARGGDTSKGEKDEEIPATPEETANLLIMSPAQRLFTEFYRETKPGAHQWAFLSEKDQADLDTMLKDMRGDLKEAKTAREGAAVKSKGN